MQIPFQKCAWCKIFTFYLMSGPPCCRVWDCLFNEGSKILLRVAITLVLINQDKILQTKDFSELVECFQTITVSDQTIYCHEFINVRFELSNDPRGRLTVTVL